MFRLITTIAMLLTAAPAAAVQVFTLAEGLAVDCVDCRDTLGAFVAGDFILSGTITLADGVARVDAAAPDGVVGFDLMALFEATFAPPGLDGLTREISGDTAQFFFDAALVVEDGVLFAEFDPSGSVVFAGAANTFLVSAFSSGNFLRLQGQLTGSPGATGSASRNVGSGPRVALSQAPSGPPAVITLPAPAALLAGGLALLAAAGVKRRRRCRG